MRDDPRVPQIPLYLVVCKKGNRAQWIETITYQDPTASIDFWETSDDYFIPKMHDHPLWVVTHYDALRRIYPLARKHLWGAIVCDEAHRIKNRDTQTAKALKSIQSIRKIALTATPMERNPADYWSILNWLYPEIFTSYWAFYNRHTLIEKTWSGYTTVLGIKDPVYLQSVLKPYRDVATKEQEAADLPPLIEQAVSIELSTKEKNLYRAVEKAKDIVVDTSDFTVVASSLVVKNQLTRLVRLQQIATDPFLLGYSIEGSKIVWAREYIKDAPSEKIILLTKFRNTCLDLAHKLSAAVITGGSPIHEGLPTLRDFTHGKCNILVGTLASISEGYDLPQAQTAIFLDIDWSATRMTQAINRIHRLGIDAPKNIIYLLAKGTVDQYIYKAVQNKWSQQELLNSLESA